MGIQFPAIAFLYLLNLKPFICFAVFRTRDDAFVPVVLYILHKTPPKCKSASVQVVYLKFPTIIPFSGCPYVTNSMSPAMGNNFLSNKNSK